MKVLHVNINYLGTALHQTMIQALDRQGVESRIFAPTSDRTKAVIQPRPNVTVAECFSKLDRWNYFLKQNKILNALLSEIDPKGFDCVHAYTLFSDGNVALRLKQKYGLPYVVAVRDTDVNAFFKYRPHLRPLGVRILRQAAAVCFLSPAYQERVLNHFVPEACREEIRAKAQIIPNGIDAFYLNHPPEGPRALPGRTLKVITVGKITPRKNILATAQALDLLRARGMEIEHTVVGAVEDTRMAQRLKNRPHTRCLPAQGKEELLKLYRGSDLFVLNSTKETFGLVYAEALSQGLPVVYTRGQGFDGQFQEGEVGHSADARNLQDIARAVELTLGEYERIQPRCVGSARKFNWADITRDYASLYEAVCKNQ